MTNLMTRNWTSPREAYHVCAIPMVQRLEEINFQALSGLGVHAPQVGRNAERVLLFLFAVRGPDEL